MVRGQRSVQKADMKKIIAGLCLTLALSAAGPEQGRKPRSEIAFSGFSWQPGEMVEINAEKMSLELKERKADFTGKVVVNKGKSQIYCDRLSVKYLESGQISWLKAEGAVKLIEGKSFATGDELEYEKDQNRIWLRGLPRLSSEGQIVLGDLMVFDLAGSRLLVDNPRLQFEKDKNEPASK